MKENNFLGRGWSFPPEFDKETAEVKLVENELDIEQSLKLLISTRPGERVTNPKYGCHIHDLMFDNINSYTLLKIKDALRNAILFFEPRISVEDIEIDREQEYEGILFIKISYLIRLTNTRSNVVFPYYKIEGSLVDGI
jgi:phage baseplate assembly protein W